ncbi:MAG: biopolymer transporter ExbD [Candidatus Omnitrophota bacterium]
MRFKKNLEFEEVQFEMAPLIDCVFLLLIFFLLTSNYIFQPGIKINLPKAVTSEVIQEKNFVITVTGEDLIYFKNQPLTLKQLRRELESIAADDRPLLIKADSNASLGKVVQIWDLCRELGLTHLNIATNHPVQ